MLVKFAKVQNGERTVSETKPVETTCSPFWYGIGAFFVAPVVAIFCILMGAMMILAWPFIPFLCYMQKKEEISKANAESDGSSIDSTCSEQKGGES